MMYHHLCHWETFRFLAEVVDVFGEAEVESSILADASVPDEEAVHTEISRASVRLGFLMDGSGQFPDRTPNIVTNQCIRTGCEEPPSDQGVYCPLHRSERLER